MPGPTVPVYRIALVREGRQQVTSRRILSPVDAATIFRQFIGDRDREVFVVMALSTKCDVIGIHTVSIGTLESTQVHPREVFKSVLLQNAATIIVAHNHPSGDPTPSPQDQTVTKRLVQAGSILGVQVHDHIILGEGERFVSLRDFGLM